MDIKNVGTTGLPTDTSGEISSADGSGETKSNEKLASQLYPQIGFSQADVIETPGAPNPFGSSEIMCDFQPGNPAEIQCDFQPGNPAGMLCSFMPGDASLQCNEQPGDPAGIKGNALIPDNIEKQKK